MLPNPYLIMATGLVFLAAVTGAYLKGEADTDNRWKAATLEQERKTQALLNAALEAARDKERALMELNTKTEKSNAEHLARINGLRIANGRLITAAGGLFDRNGRPRHPDTGAAAPAPPGSAGSGPTGCELSKQTSDDLSDLAYDADLAAVYAHTCKAHVVELHALIKDACRAAP